MNLRASSRVCKMFSAIIINTEEIINYICVKCLRCCLSPTWVKILPLWESCSYMFQYKLAAFSSIVLQKSSFSSVCGFIDFLNVYFTYKWKGKNVRLHEIYTFRNWKESQKGRKSQEAMKDYRWDFLFTLDSVIIVVIS